MPFSSYIKIKGKIAKIIDSNFQKKASIVCDGSQVMVSLENINDVSLGDSITISGKLIIDSISVDGIEIKNNIE